MPVLTPLTVQSGQGGDSSQSLQLSSGTGIVTTACLDKSTRTTALESISKAIHTILHYHALAQSVNFTTLQRTLVWLKSPEGATDLSIEERKEWENTGDDELQDCSKDGFNLPFQTYTDCYGLQPTTRNPSLLPNFIIQLETQPPPNRPVASISNPEIILQCHKHTCHVRLHLERSFVCKDEAESGILREEEHFYASWPRDVLGFQILDERLELNTPREKTSKTAKTLTIPSSLVIIVAVDVGGGDEEDAALFNTDCGVVLEVEAFELLFVDVEGVGWLEEEGPE
ncbi:hypothetical protein BDP27DRAFT_1374666 [Rhodocollybia butyracea]|uniref:Uncharacterized protein n=1 Tax=Rhodocollybia butyracea TaxID=206335 RepID=A0A9P5TVW1_9AGAR|nr:hypothetical protein BDP27DRAFT_1374666 [Rhodocollybia butyracea]